MTNTFFPKSELPEVSYYEITKALDSSQSLTANLSVTHQPLITINIESLQARLVEYDQYSYTGISFDNIGLGSVLLLYIQSTYSFYMFFFEYHGFEKQYIRST